MHTSTWFPRPLTALATGAILLSSTGAGSALQNPERLLSVGIESAAARDLITAAIVERELRIVTDDEGTVMRLQALEPADTDPLEKAFRRPVWDSGCYLVSDFEFASRNRLGGRFAAFARAPSKAVARLVRDDEGRRLLRLEYTRADRGYGGMTIELHSPDPDYGVLYYLDSRPFTTLAFWVRGESRGAPVRLRLADATASNGGDAIKLGALAGYLPGGELDGAWQLAVVHLDGLPEQIDRSQLAKLVIDPAGPGSGRIDIDRLALCGDSALPELPSASVPRPDRATPTALWMWHTGDLIASETERRLAAEFIAARGIERVYLQLPGSLTSADLAAEVDQAAAELHPVVAALADAGALVLALDGFEEYALRRWHDEVEQAVRNVARYNRSVPAAARFAGVHFDVEPYLLPEFGGTERPRIVREYLELLDRLAATTAAENLEFEVAIPAWFDSIWVTSGPENAPVFQALSEMVIDRTDSVAIMDYRTMADGSNGTIALAESELAYASTVGKQVWVGLETTALPDEETIMFGGTLEEGFPARQRSRGWVALVPSEPTPRLVFVPGDALERLQAELRRDGIEPRDIRTWPVTRHSRLLATRLTFAELGADRLHAVMRDSEAEMARHLAFAGFAIHYYRPYAELLGQVPD